MVEFLEVYIFFLALKFSRDHKAICSTKLNHVRFDGEPDNSFCLPTAPDGINTGHKITEGQLLLIGLGFHSRVPLVMSEFSNHDPGDCSGPRAWMAAGRQNRNMIVGRITRRPLFLTCEILLTVMARGYAGTQDARYQVFTGFVISVNILLPRYES